MNARYVKTLYPALREVLERRSAGSTINLLEVGTYRGINARRMIKQCLGLGFKVNYHGFDLFEDLTDRRFQISLSQIDKELSGISPDAKIYLYRGDSRNTLPPMVSDFRNFFDFIFLDGGHSIETIHSDFNAISKMLLDDGILAMDDYYDERDSSGCKKLVLSKPRGWDFEIGKAKDWSKRGMSVRIVLARKTH